MTCHTKEELEQMLFDVVNELDLSDSMSEEHGPNGTPPAVIVREVLAQKDRIIAMLRNGFVEVGKQREQSTDIVERLRNTPNWRKETFGSWKDCVSVFDRAPFEAANETERKRSERARKRAAGLVPVQEWVHREDADRLRRYAARLRRERDKGD